LNRAADKQCAVCSRIRHDDEIYAGGDGLLAMARLRWHKAAWSVTSVGPSWLQVASASAAVARSQASRILSAGLYPDQSVVIRPVGRRYRVYIVRGDISPYPSGLGGSLAEEFAVSDAEAVDFWASLRPAVTSDPAASSLISKLNGRMLLGYVKWFSAERGFGLIRSTAPGLDRLGDIFLHQADICNVEPTGLSGGQSVCFYLESTSAGPRARSALVLDR